MQGAAWILWLFVAAFAFVVLVAIVSGRDSDDDDIGGFWP